MLKVERVSYLAEIVIFPYVLPEEDRKDIQLALREYKTMAGATVGAEEPSPRERVEELKSWCKRHLDEALIRDVESARAYADVLQMLTDIRPSPGQLSAEDERMTLDEALVIMDAWASEPFPTYRDRRAWEIVRSAARLSEHPAAPQAEVTEERKAMLEYLAIVKKSHEEFLHNTNNLAIRAGETVWDYQDKLNKWVKKVKALILARPAPVRVSRKDVKEWAKTVTEAGDHYSLLKIEEFLVLTEANENYLTDKLREKGIVVEPEKGAGE